VQQATANLSRDRGVVEQARATLDKDRGIVQQAKATLEKDRGIVQQARMTLAKDKGVVEQARMTLEKDQGSVKQAIATLTKDRAQAQYAEAQSQRYAALYKQGVISQDQAQQYATSSRAAEATVDLDKQAIANAETAVKSDRIGIANAETAVKSDRIGIANAEAAVKSDEVAIANAETAVKSDLVGIENAETAVKSDLVGIENARAVVEGSRAAIEGSQAGLSADGGALKNAQVQSSYTKVYAPIDGRAGNVLVTIGNVVQANNEIVQNLRSQLAEIPGIQVFLQNPPAIPLGTQQSTGLYQLALQSSDVLPLREYVPQLVDKMKAMPEIQDVNSDLQMTSQIKVDIARDKASALGITASQIENTLRNAYGAYQVSTIYGASNEYQVILELEPKYQKDPNALMQLYIATTSSDSSDASGGKTQVPLATFAKITPGVAPLIVNHVGRMNAATISYNLAPGVALGNANSAIDKIVKSVIPDSIAPNYKGASQVFQSSLPSLGFLLAVAILVIYLILGILYEDFIHPITILSGLPSAGFGALLTLMLFGVDLNVYSFIGIILLVGIVKKNGIMMVDFAIEAQRDDGKKPAEAIYQACLVRFRPIMMTTMAALMGTLPIALGVGAGSESRRPLGIAVVGGLLFSQILTVYLTLVFYIYMESWRKKLSEVKFRQVFSFK
jgi:multidrug resistance efflux pump